MQPLPAAEGLWPAADKKDDKNRVTKWRGVITSYVANKMNDHIYLSAHEPAVRRPITFQNCDSWFRLGVEIIQSVSSLLQSGAGVHH